MKKRIARILLLVLMLSIFIVVPVYAEVFSSQITVANTTATGYGQIPVAVACNNSYLVTNKFTSSTMLDTKIATLPMMPTNNMTWTALPLANSSSNAYTWSTGNAVASSHSIIFGYSGYATLGDWAGGEFGNNFSSSLSGYVDTSSGSNKNLLYKQGAFKTYVSGASTVTSAIMGQSYSGYSSTSDGYVYGLGGNTTGANALTTGTVDNTSATFKVGQRQITNDVDQTSNNTTGYAVYGGRAVGERFDNFFGTITAFSLYLIKDGLPTGTLTCNVYKVSDGSLIGTLGTSDVSAATGYRTYNSTPIVISSAMNIRIAVTYSGGDNSNHVDAQSQNTNPLADAQYTIFDSATWSDTAGSDVRFQDLTYTTVEISRGALYFDTSSIPDDAIIDSATLKYYGQGDSSTTDFNVTVTNGQATYPHDPLATGDYNKANFTGSGGTLSTATFDTGGYNSLTLNATGLSWIDVDGTTKLYLVSSRDIAITACTGDEYVTIYATEQAGTANDPLLEVTYSVPVSATVASGAHVITTALSGGTLNITVDGVEADTTSFAGSVPNNGYSWVIGENNCLPYLTYYKHTVGGVEVTKYQPVTILTDIGANYTTGTVTLTTGSSGVIGAGGAAFTTNMVGGYIKGDTDAVYYQIISVDSATTLTINAPYLQTGGAGLAYTIVYYSTATLPDEDTGDGAQDATITFGSSPFGITTSMSYLTTGMISSSTSSQNNSDIAGVVGNRAYTSNSYYNSVVGESATFTNGSNMVSGTSTTWTSQIEGGLIRLDADDSYYTIDKVLSNTSLRLTANYDDTGGNGAYTLNYSLVSTSNPINPFMKIISLVMNLENGNKVMPIQYLWIILAMCLVVGIMALSLKYLANQLVTSIACIALSILFYKINVFPLAVVIMLVVGCISVVVFERKPSL